MQAWALFCLASSQWRVGMGGATGLDYAGVAALARWEGIEITSTVSDLLRTLEFDRLKLWNEEAKEKEKKTKR